MTTTARNLLLTSLTSAVFASAATLGVHRLFATDSVQPVAESIPRTGQVAREDRERIEAAVQGLTRRILELEAGETRTTVPASVAATPAPIVAGTGSEEAAVDPRRFRALLTKVLRSSHDGEASEDEQAQFWAAARSGNLLADVIKDLRKGVSERPNDPELRMDLADAYVARLLTVPSGPERGVWGMKAEREWREALDIDPDHWDAQYALAFNHSMYPDFLNKTDDAILGFERALEIQKAKPHEARHANTYLGLVRMYRKKGRTDDAIKVLREAVMLYPKNLELATTLEGLEADNNRSKRK